MAAGTRAGGVRDVIGGGHSGLACAAYLARAGLDVLVLERRGLVGGAAGHRGAVAWLPGLQCLVRGQPAAAADRQ
ncbi:MAG: FAD-dependent oxidoreductase [Streptosporangiaceae bacterium]